MVEVDRSHRSSAMSSTAEDLEDYRTLGDDDVEDLKPLSSSLREGKPVDMSSFFEPPGEANPPPRFEVRSMPWTDADGHSGHFTGEVNSASVPDGKGFMRYDSLPMLEGKWEEGRHVPDPGYDDMPLTSEEMRGGRPRGAGNLKTIIERSFTSQGTEAYSHLDRGDGDSSTATPQRGGGGRARPPFMQPLDGSGRSNSNGGGGNDSGGWDDDSCVEDVTPRATLAENDRTRQQRRMQETINRSKIRRNSAGSRGPPGQNSPVDQNNVSARSRSSSSGRSGARGAGGRTPGMDNSISDEVSGYSRTSGYSDRSVSRGVQRQSSSNVLGEDEEDGDGPGGPRPGSGHGGSNLSSSNRDGNVNWSNRDGNLNSSNREGNANWPNRDGNLNRSNRDGNLNRSNRDGNLNRSNRDGNLNRSSRDGNLDRSDRDRDGNFRPNRDGNLDRSNRDRDGNLNRPNQHGNLNRSNRDGNLDRSNRDRDGNLDRSNRDRDGNLNRSNRDGNLDRSNRDKNFNSFNSSNREREAMLNVSLNEEEEDEGEGEDEDYLKPLRRSGAFDELNDDDDSSENLKPLRRSSTKDEEEEDDSSEDLKPLRRSEARSDAELSASLRRSGAPSESSFRRSARSARSDAGLRRSDAELSSQGSHHSPLPPGQALPPGWEEWNTKLNSKDVKSSFNSILVQKPSHLNALLAAQADDDNGSKSEHSEHTASTAAQSNRGRGRGNGNGGGNANNNGWRGPANPNPFMPNQPVRAPSLRNPGPARQGGTPGGNAGGGGGFNWAMPPPPHSNADDLPPTMRPSGGAARHGDSMVGKPLSRRQMDMLELRSSSNDDDHIELPNIGQANAGPKQTSSLYPDVGESDRSNLTIAKPKLANMNGGNPGGPPNPRRQPSGGLLAMAHPKQGGIDDSESSGRNGYGFRTSGSNHDGLVMDDVSPRGDMVTPPMYDDEINSQAAYDSDEEARRYRDGVDESYRSSRSGGEEEGHSENEEGGRYSRMRRLNSTDGIGGAFLHMFDGARDRVDRHFEPMNKDQRKKRKIIYFSVFLFGLILFIAVLASIPKGKKKGDASKNSKMQQGGGSKGSSNVPAVAPKISIAPTASPSGTPPPPCVDLQVEIRTDELGGQTTWELLLVEAAEVVRERPHADGYYDNRRRGLSSSAGPGGEHAVSGNSGSMRRSLVELVARGGPYPDAAPGSLSGAEEPSSGGPHVTTACLAAGRYEFILDDSGFNGMCCDRGRGGYTLTLGGGEADGVGRVVKVGSGFFTSQDRVGFEVTADDVAGVGSEGFPSSVPSGAPSELPSISTPDIPGLRTMTTISHSVLLSGVGRTYGIIFDIIASPEVPGLSISGMDILIDSSTSEEYEIWTKDPSMLDFDLASFGSVVGRGMSKLARIPLGEFDDVLVPGGSARTVWVTLKSDRLFVQSHVRSGLVSTRQGIVSTSAEVGDDQIMASSDDGGLLSVLYGEAVDGYPINAAGDFTDHRGFLGRIYYAVTEEVESDMPSVQPSVSSTSRPSSASTEKVAPSSASGSTSYPTPFPSLAADVVESAPSGGGYGFQSSVTPKPTSSPTTLAPTVKPTPPPTTPAPTNPRTAPPTTSPLNVIFSVTQEGAHDLSLYGFANDMSSDGRIVAVGAIKGENVEGVKTGAVYMYFNNPDKPNLDPVLFQTMYGDVEASDFGSSVALSADGKLLVVGARFEKNNGAMRIYTLADGEYSMVGMIEGQPKDRAGWSCAVSGDGTVIALGAVGGGEKRGGIVLTFKSDGTNWASYGSIIEGQTKDDFTGASLALNYDGTILAVGSSKAEKNPSSRNGGKAVVYGIDQSADKWTFRDTIWAAEKNAADGSAVALSNDGKTLVVGAKGLSFGGIPQGGRCRVFITVGNKKKFQRIHSILGGGNKEQIGHSVAVSGDGNIVACGGMGGTSSDGTVPTGIVRLYNRAENSEKVLRADGEKNAVAQASFGSSLSLSTDGKIVAVGAQAWSGGGDSKKGGVQMFEIEWY